jgi:hypothetical protein
MPVRRARFGAIRGQVSRDHCNEPAGARGRFTTVVRGARKWSMIAAAGTVRHSKLAVQNSIKREEAAQ